MEKYILQGEEVTKCNSLIEWAEWFENQQNTILKQDTVGTVFISTIFLGLDFNHTGEGDPVLFETLIRRGGRYEKCVKHTNYKKAIEFHEKVLNRTLSMAGGSLETKGKAINLRMQHNRELLKKHNFDYVKTEFYKYHLTTKKGIIIFYLKDASWRVQGGGLLNGGLKTKGFDKLLDFLKD